MAMFSVNEGFPLNFQIIYYTAHYIQSEYAKPFRFRLVTNCKHRLEPTADSVNAPLAYMFTVENWVAHFGKFPWGVLFAHTFIGLGSLDIMKNF